MDDLHFFLTGISWIYPKRLKEIVAAMIDLEKKMDDFSAEEFGENVISQMDWNDVPEEDLKNEILETFEEFKEFLSDITDRGNGVVIS